MKKFSILLFSILTLAISSCIKTDECKDVVCTEVFKSITIKIIDSQNLPVLLDSYKTIKDSNNETFTIADSFSGDGIYTIIDDSHKHKTATSGSTFIFEGTKNNVVVVSEEFVITKDCCHISLKSGKTEISL